jgi:hypothetical protein
MACGDDQAAEVVVLPVSPPGITRVRVDVDVLPTLDRLTGIFQVVNSWRTGCA